MTMRGKLIVIDVAETCEWCKGNVKEFPIDMNKTKQKTKTLKNELWMAQFCLSFSSEMKIFLSVLCERE